MRGCRWQGTYRDLGVDIKAKLLKWTGVPVTVGIAGTKTLAKVANHLALVPRCRVGV
jgi:DNA polymerase V